MNPNLSDKAAIREWAQQLMLDLVPSWVEKGTKSPEFLFAKSQRLTKEEIEKVPSWAEKGTQLLLKDTPNAPDNRYVITEKGKAFLMGK